MLRMCVCVNVCVCVCVLCMCLCVCVCAACGLLPGKRPQALQCVAVRCSALQLVEFSLHVDCTCCTCVCVCVCVCVFDFSPRRRTNDLRQLDVFSKEWHQHTLKHCNTLQHTATHCNTLQHATRHWNTLQYTIIRFHHQRVAPTHYYN